MPVIEAQTDSKSAGDVAAAAECLRGSWQANFTPSA